MLNLHAEYMISCLNRMMKIEIEISIRIFECDFIRNHVDTRYVKVGTYEKRVFGIDA